MTDTHTSGEPTTPEGLLALRTEIEELEGTATDEIAERIRVAAELGDLKENTDYNVAKEEQTKLEAKIKDLRRHLDNSVEIPVDTDTADSFAFGRTAEVLEEGSGTVNTWTIVGETEADFKEGRLSIGSPVGKALMNASIDVPVTVETPRGARVYRVQKLVG